MSMNYKGSRWFKCDLHLHTPASQCFSDKAVTAKQWVERAIEQGLDCVAVTDHNTGEWIDAIKKAAEGTALTVFPGVEITCDTSKIHILLIFDIDKTTEYINDFLIGCDISRPMFANMLAGTLLTVFDIAKKAHDEGAIVIPAHIDDFNGLYSVGSENLKKLFDLKYINAVQVIHNKFTNKTLKINNNEDLRHYINDYYCNPNPPIDFAKISDWYKPVKLAVDKNLAILSFSDNPNGPKEGKHGLYGIGSHYTWIKMDEKPTLEGIRQAFLLPDFRVKNEYISATKPYKIPDLWIKSISISCATFSDESQALRVDFNPQLTTIIGGRGSGKSSILRFIRGVFNRVEDINDLEEIKNNHHDFYKLFDKDTKKGVLTNATLIDVEFVRNKVLYKVSASNIFNSSRQTVDVFKFDSLQSIWTPVTASAFLDFFSFEQYSQKQIYEIAQEPNSLKDRIDKSVPEVMSIKSDLAVTKKLFLEKSASIRTINLQISGKGKLQTEISDIEERIKIYQDSGISSLLSSKEKFASQNKNINDFVDKLKLKEKEIANLICNIVIPDINYADFNVEHAKSLECESKLVIDGYNKIKSQLQIIKADAEQLRSVFEASLLKTSWKADYDDNQTSFAAKKAELEAKGIDDISNFETLTAEKQVKESELTGIVNIEAGLESELLERKNLRGKYLLQVKNITSLRKKFVKEFLQDEKVKVSINAFRNRNDFIAKLRSIIQRDTGFKADIDSLCNTYFKGNVENNMDIIVNIFKKIKSGESVPGITGYLVNLINSMSESQMDEIELLFPDDEIEVKYKPSAFTEFRPLSTASAGQKTTAILTLILAHGKMPLILDQPEDDLDNRLVYELIVDRLKQAKECRQLIIVTHNANIPVNGDAEYILSMNSESKKLKVFCSGTLEQAGIKKEICDVMEGSEQAFDMRSRRYKQI